MAKSKIETYIVNSGNWKVKVKLDDSSLYGYIEAGTRALEAVFGRKEFGPDCEIFSLLSLKGKEFFDEQSEAEMVPPPMFSIFVAVCRERDIKEKTKFRLFLTSQLFANASQPVNVTLAKQAEVEEPDKVKKFLNAIKKSPKKKKKI